MNILGVGAPELFLILIIALIVAGPQRMIRWAYHLGKWSAKMRAMWNDLMTVVQHEIDQAGLEIEVPRNVPTRRDLTRMIESAAKPYVKPLEETMNEVRQVKTEAQGTLQQTRNSFKDLNSEVQKSTKPDHQNGVDFGTWSGKE